MVHHTSFSFARIGTKDRHEMATYAAWKWTLAFKPFPALSPVHVDVGKLFPSKNQVFFPNRQSLFPVEIHAIGQIVNSRRHCWLHDGRHIVGLGTWGEPVITAVMHRIGLGSSAQCLVHQGVGGERGGRGRGEGGGERGERVGAIGKRWGMGFLNRVGVWEPKWPQINTENKTNKKQLCGFYFGWHAEIPHCSDEIEVPYIRLYSSKSLDPSLPIALWAACLREQYRVWNAFSDAGARNSQMVDGPHNAVNCGAISLTSSKRNV